MTSIEADESRACFLSLLQFELNLFHSKLPGLYWILCYRSYSLVLANNRFYFTVSTTSIFILFTVIVEVLRSQHLCKIPHPCSQVLLCSRRMNVPSFQQVTEKRHVVPPHVLRCRNCHMSPARLFLSDGQGRQEKFENGSKPRRKRGSKDVSRNNSRKHSHKVHVWMQLGKVN